MKTMGTNMNSDAFLIINQVKNKMKHPSMVNSLTLLHTKCPKLYGVWGTLCAVGLNII